MWSYASILRYIEVVFVFGKIPLLLGKKSKLWLLVLKGIRRVIVIIILSRGKRFIKGLKWTCPNSEILKNNNSEIFKQQSLFWKNKWD